MSTAIDYQSPPPSNIRSRHHDSSQNQSTLDHVDSLNGIELTDLNSAPPPPYTERANEPNPITETTSSTSEAQTSLIPANLLLQVETTGKPILSLPLPPHPDPIPIYLVDPSSSSPGDTTYLATAPKFISLRPSRSSGSCYLISGDTHSPSSPSSSTAATNSPPLSTTTYRFGPGRPPRVRIFNPYSNFSTAGSQIQDASNGLNPGNDQDEQGRDLDSTAYSSFDILSSGLLTRAVRFKPPRLLDDNTSLASGVDEGRIIEQFFEWRYASHKERKLYSSASPFSAEAFHGHGKSNSVDSLLILSKTTIFAKPHAQSSGLASISKDKMTVTETVPLARLVRSSVFRTKGSAPSSAGNGGRLEILDLGKAGYPENDKSKREMVLVMIVTTCLIMFKREVDRRRAQQIAVLSGALGGS